jgi:hypothetical protein
MHLACVHHSYLWFAQHAAYSSSGYWHGVSQRTLVHAAVFIEQLVRVQTAWSDQCTRSSLFVCCCAGSPSDASLRSTGAGV